jgi:hypothetical protein
MKTGSPDEPSEMRVFSGTLSLLVISRASKGVYLIEAACLNGKKWGGPTGANKRILEKSDKVDIA